MSEFSQNKCKKDKGAAVRSWLTGDAECGAVSTEYECGGVYNKNYMDIIGYREHDCFWDCSECKGRWKSTEPDNTEEAECRK